MVKTETEMDDAALEAFFAAGRARTPEPGAEVMARILADAEAELAARTSRSVRSWPVRSRPIRSWPVRSRSSVGRPRRLGVWTRFLDGIGGWPALASLGAAAVAGVWIGFAVPDRINTLAGGLLLPDAATSDMSYELEDLLPGYAGFEGLAEESAG